MKSNLDHSVERLVNSQDYRARATGLGTTREAQAVVRQHWKPLADRIAIDRTLGRRDKTVWGALKGISDDDLALRLLVAGISVGGSDELGVDRDDQKTFRDTALWIGRNLCPRHGAEMRLKVGAWGVGLLLEALPSFFALTAADVLFLTESVYDLMDGVLARAVKSNPFLTPLTEPPQPWTGVLTGGLPPGHWARVPLIREHHRSIEEAARKAIGTGRMQPALDAINTLQSVPFTINKPIFDFLYLATPSASPLSDLKVWEMDISTAAVLTLNERFWVPLTIDFRGRLYGIPHFNFSRADHVRGLFLFADGEPIGKDGLRWLKAHVAARADGNSWSLVKKPSNLDLDARIAWTDENLELLRKIGEAVLRRDDPATLDWVLRNDKGKFLDDIYQLLAACVELVQALDGGPNFITRLPLTFDATCSGLQHLCGMTRDEDGGRYVNLVANGDLVATGGRIVIDDDLIVTDDLVATDDADDFYRRVAYRVWVIGTNQVRALMDGPFDRKIVKQPAMSYFYGSRAGGFTKDKKGRWHPYGMTEQVIEVLKERGKPTKGAKELAHAIYNEIEGMVPRAKAVRDFLEQLAKLCADNGKPLRWATPLGLPVLNEYHRPDDKDIEVRLNGRRKTTTLVIGDREGIRRTKAVNAVTANFVHSVDAAHLQFVALAAAKEGIGMVSVHDCFGCLASRAARFNQIILEQFVRLHEKHNLLNEVRESARRDLPKSIELPPLPEIGSLEIKAIPQSRHAYK